jgi:hypothetical protein
MDNKQHVNHQIIYVTNSAYDELQTNKAEAKPRHPGGQQKRGKLNDR